MANALRPKTDNALMEHKAFQRPSVTLNPKKVNALAALLGPFPVAGDIAGLAADALMYAKEPESRRWYNYLLTAAGALPMVPGAAHAIFAGPLAKTADLSALDRAKAMVKMGTPDEQIWRETGWWVNAPDGVPRFEIPDNQAHFNERGYQAFRRKREGSESTYGEIFKHPELEQAYPELAHEMPIGRLPMGEGGSASPSGFDYMNLGPSYKDIGGRTEDHSTMLHELQHLVQGHEGMMMGGNPQQFVESIPLSVQKKADALRAKFEALPGGSDERISLVNEYDKLVSPYTPWGKYKRLGGEAEARAVVSRQNMTRENRRKIPPWDSYDVPMDEVVAIIPNGRR